MQNAVVFWLRRNLFSSVAQTVLTLLLLTVIGLVASTLIRWGIIDAVGFDGTAEQCRAATGACWAVIGEKYRPILFGLYPYDEQWRAALAMLVWFITIGLSLSPMCWHSRLLWPLWLVSIALMSVLMSGGLFGLKAVPSSDWGGLPLTLLLFSGTVIIGMPVSVILALGRRSPLPFLRGLSVIFIEGLRGVPLITILFVAVNVFPLFLPAGMEVNKLLRVIIGIALFFACYQAEVIRGGLQAVPRGQYEAAAVLNLGYWHTTTKIVLPQALRICLPAVTNHIIAAMKNSSFVIIIGLFDVLTATTAAMQDPQWRRYYIETYVFIASLYLVFGFLLSRYAVWVEKRIDASRNPEGVS
ncbi:amino acid ABC transporter permease [Kosakonia radicincitans]|uniref:amino acid ABC transporter permease n=1 Tax=Kosakonia radicincitans TaxID=283686 RepID=UPI00090327C5|nr:amino acid ABC transporter permease [Kosakonia radicincitans]APG18080.1 amino acid ABC transporter permease [Kosakonia radicincitans]SKC21948.1 general L-amino acid transport system permease protein [Kosakonia radicincitans]